LDCPVYLLEIAIQKIHVEEHLSFPEAQKRYFEVLPKQTKVTYAQAVASCHLTSKMSTQTDNAAPAPDTDGSKVYRI
jgi:hypothetical protein